MTPQIIRTLPLHSYLEHKVIVEVSFVLSVLRAGLEGGRLRRGRHALESEINQKCYEDVNKTAR